MFFIQLLFRLFQLLIGLFHFRSRRNTSKSSSYETSVDNKEIKQSTNNQLISFHPTNNSPLKYEFTELEMLANTFIETNPTKYEAMRIKKHFTTSTNLLIKEYDKPYFIGSFSNSTELRNIKKSPFSFIPYLSELFTRNEYMIVKSAILVFITAKKENK
ncbi:hypothetical protein ABK040_014359 [Willaertia magna]